MKFALRQLAKSPGFTALVILTLALGIGASTSIFSVVNSVVFQPLPYPHSERLVMLYEAWPPKAPLMPVAPATYLSWRDQSADFDAIALWNFRSNNVTGRGDPFRVYDLASTANLFSLLGVQPMLGRTFLPDEGTPGKNHVVILSHRIWQSRFASQADIVGQTLLFDEEPYLVIGIMPESFAFAPGTDVFTPLTFDAGSRSNYQRDSNAVGRLKPGVSPDHAGAGLSVISRRLAQSIPNAYKGYGATVVPLLEANVGGVKEMSFLLLGAVGCLLLVACTNIANLLLARASTRRREIAVRTVLGASRGRVIRQLLAESLLLAVGGGICGLLAGKWGLDALIPFLPWYMPRLNEITLDGTALVFTSVLTLCTGVIFGLVPALQASRVDLNTSLKESAGRRGSAGGNAARLRSALVVAEMALALMLLAAAGLFFRSMLKAQHNPLGFETKTTYTNVLLLSDKKYPSVAQRNLVVEQLTARIAQVPNVAAATFTNHTTPSGGAPMTVFSIAGRPPIEASLLPRCFYYGVTPDYFKTLLVPLLRGRFFTAQDTLGAPRVAVINEEIAKKYFPDEDPIGKQIVLMDGGPRVAREIVGVVANVRQSNLFMPMTPQFYEPYAQVPGLSTSLIIRTSGGPLDTHAVIAAIHGVDPTLPLDTMYSMATGLDLSLAAYRIAVMLFGVFSGVALLLAAMGIYGVMAYNVAQRTGEIGIRMALGAQRRDVLGLILKQGSRLILLGLLLGWVGSLAMTRFLRSQLYETSAYDPTTLLCITIILAGVALLATWLPARRATKVDPMVALRAE